MRRTLVLAAGTTSKATIDHHLRHTARVAVRRSEDPVLVNQRATAHGAPFLCVRIGEASV